MLTHGKHGLKGSLIQISSGTMALLVSFKIIASVSGGGIMSDLSYGGYVDKSVYVCRVQ